MNPMPVDGMLVAQGSSHERISTDADFGHPSSVARCAPGGERACAPAARFYVPRRQAYLDAFEVRHVRAPGQIDVDLDELLKPE